jgi:hypothetical protein
MCALTDVWWRLFLALSNGTLLYPLSRAHPKEAFLEFLTVLSTMLCSALYHWCDALDPCTRVCVLRWGILWRLDFILAYQMLPTVAMFHSPSAYRYPFLGVTAAANVLFVLYLKDDYGDHLYLPVLAAVCLLVGGLRFLEPEFRPSREILKTKGVGSLLMTGTAVVWFFLGVAYLRYYAMFHGLWHFCIGFAIGGAFEVIADTERNRQQRALLPPAA